MKQSELKEVLKWLAENNKTVEDLKNLEVDMQLVHDLQNKGLMENPSIQYYAGDGITIVTQSNRLATVGISKLIDGNYFYLRSFFIPKTHRGKGVGKEVFNQIKNYAFKYPFVKFIELEPTETSKEFWLKLGFKEATENKMRLWN